MCVGFQGGWWSTPWRPCYNYCPPQVNSSGDKATVVATKEGAIIHILDGKQTPMQVRDFLAKHYDIVSQQKGQGFITLPTKDHPGGLLIDPKMTRECSRYSIFWWLGKRSRVCIGRRKCGAARVCCSALFHTVLVLRTLTCTFKRNWIVIVQSATSQTIVQPFANGAFYRENMH